MMSHYKFETNAIRTQAEQTHNREHSVPLYLTSSFTFESAAQGAAIFKGEEEANLYSRFSNPNTTELVDKLCILEKCEAGVATASGMAAVYTSFVAHLQQGDHILASKDIFGNASYIIREILTKMGVTHTFVPIDDNKAWEEAIQPNTKILYAETPSNPTLKIGDIQFLSDLAKANNAILAIDNCFATPYLQEPAVFGADLVIHSATKYIDGQGRVLGGAILGKKELIDECYNFIRRTGASLSPFNAWVLSKSLETLAIRMDRHCANALAIAEYLSNHPKIDTVTYPFLGEGEQQDLARKQMRLGGGLVGFELKGGLEKGVQFLNGLEIHSLTANLGDCRSIATHPASTTHSKLTKAQQLDAGITESYVRLSVGLENVEDLIKDIEQSLGRV